jgi:hypothetical protein
MTSTGHLDTKTQHTDRQSRVLRNPVARTTGAASEKLVAPDLFQLRPFAFLFQPRCFDHFPFMDTQLRRRASWLTRE